MKKQFCSGSVFRGAAALSFFTLYAYSSFSYSTESALPSDITDSPSPKAARYLITFNETLTKDAPNTDLLLGPAKARSGSRPPRRELDEQKASQLLQVEGVQPLKTIRRQRLVAAELTDAQLQRLQGKADINRIEPDHVRYLMAQNIPYGYNLIQASQLSQSDTSARKVCVLDTGYQLGHPDLPDQNNGASGEANNSEVGQWYVDGYGHGTHVAGTIAAYDNFEGMVGVYPGVSIHAVKVFDNRGNWTYSSDLIEGLNQCRDAGANVINMSLGGAGSSLAEQNAFEDVAADGILLVASAGNDGTSTLNYPASYDSVMSVAAVNSQERRASFSQFNYQVEIAAPGVNVLSTVPTNEYASYSGTSMAAPHVAGAAALVWSFFPECGASEIRQALNLTAKDKGRTGRDPYFGYGIVQVADAYDYISTQGCEGDPEPIEEPGIEPIVGGVENITIRRNDWYRTSIDVPEGARSLVVTIQGGLGDADLYLNHLNQPSLSRYVCRPYNGGNEESCEIANPQPGTWHIGLYAYLFTRNVDLSWHIE
ncbi:peptidase S8 [Alteromonas aestuariivivens]|uniref:Peptidase S8 n=1 Tax=Alteromonas aestuariivivens TaxID=1938339 RepID=A0A3D8MA96_9ALTE|nr:S8 family serine peptidase [Alteromonas aestuariivivens]RDV26598.1 peptidase S8 [Alteromonas aestuariivivens]